MDLKYNSTYKNGEVDILKKELRKINSQTLHTPVELLRILRSFIYPKTTKKNIIKY